MTGAEPAVAAERPVEVEGGVEPPDVLVAGGADEPGAVDRPAVVVDIRAVAVGRGEPSVVDGRCVDRSDPVVSDLPDSPITTVVGKLGGGDEPAAPMTISMIAALTVTTPAMVNGTDRLRMRRILFGPTATAMSAR